MKRPVKYLIAFTVALIGAAALIPDRSKMPNIDLKGFGLDTLCGHICVTGRPHPYASPVGYHYELMRRYAGSTKGNFKYVSIDDTINNCWDAFMDGHMHLIALNLKRDSIPHGMASRLYVSPAVNRYGDVWVVKKSDTLLVKSIATWIYNHLHGPEYRHLHNRFYKNEPPKTPYDSLLKAYAPTCGIPRKLLASMMYYESKFTPNAESHRGAKGLMQIRPYILQKFGGGNIYDPEENLRAACGYLRYLRNNAGLSTADSLDKLHFLLATYNTGQGKMETCRSMADSCGKNRNSWNDVVEFLPAETKKYMSDVWSWYKTWR